MIKNLKPVKHMEEVGRPFSSTKKRHIVTDHLISLSLHLIYSDVDFINLRGVRIIPFPGEQTLRDKLLFMTLQSLTAYSMLFDSCSLQICGDSRPLLL